MDDVQDDELNHNPFLAALQVQFRRDFEDAVQVQGSIVCVPRSDALRSLVIDRQLIRSHLFRPSPYFKGQYVNSSDNHHVDRIIEIGDKEIVRISGFHENTAVKIFQEESGYDTKCKSYKIYVIERPLDSDSSKPVISSKGGVDPDAGIAPITSAECAHILQDLGNGKVLTDLQTRVALFARNYLLLPKYVDDASRKLKSIVDATMDDITDGDYESKPADTIHAAIESYVLSGVHEQLFPAICQHFKADDSLLSDKLLSLRQLNVSATQLGADVLFACPLPATVVELATLDCLASPRQKLQCMKNVMDLIMAEIKQNLQETQGVLTPPGGMPFLTSDNLIPVLLTAMVCAQLQHLASDLYYAENFVWGVSSKDAHGYSLVTFKAAVGFLKMLDIGALKPQSSDVAKKELSLEELMRVTENLDGKTIRSEDDDGNTQWTPVDRQMERIARMIEASTRELTAVQHQGVIPNKTYYNV